ncbi:HRDC domain-containing protein [Flavobacterium sp. SM15]|uniref:HRDC domain-containing protein n=1 Tax=Flavobacterium sp. SM15 TaxID=2908005 RepID=UPI001EDBFFA0|nr:HRDC domain-containing protein [Flavobacterium sp. SM15]MCG2610258.1 HRDC domain-containing protein [Flavobacterium sp. SM15]
MYIEVFAVRLIAQELESDQKKINDFLETVKFVKSATHFVELEQGGYWSVLVHYELKEKPKKESKIDKKPNIEESDLSPGSSYVLECLKEWRADKAESLKVPRYYVCTNSELVNIAFYLPKTIDELKEIKGFGSVKTEKLGADIIALLNAV